MSELLHRFDEELNGGINPSVHSRNAPLIVDGYNVYFDENAVKPYPGQYLIYGRQVNEPCVGLLEANISGTPTLFAGHLTSIFKYTNTGGTGSVGTGYTAPEDQVGLTPAGRWSMVPWGAWVVATNGTDQVQVYKGSSFANLSGPGFTRAQILVPFKSLLLAFNTNTAETHIAWCADDDIEDWSAGISGELYSRDLESGIMAAVPYAGSIAYFGTASMHAVRWTGFPDYFGLFPAVNKCGACSKDAVVTAKGLIYGFDQLGPWVSDGTTVDRKFTEPVLSAILDDFNEDQMTKVVAFDDTRRQCVIFFYPTADSNFNNASKAFSYKHNVWAPPKFGRSAASDEGVFGYPIFGNAQGDVLRMVEGTPPNVAGSPLQLESKANLTTGLGMLGIGEGGLGGFWEVDG